jgi:hypothetical protein
MMRVWIAYEPQVFREALITVISQMEMVDIIEDATSGVDVGIFRLGATGQLQSYFRFKPLPNSKMIVFAPQGNRAYIRLPHEMRWTEVEPFGVPQLLAEIRAGRDRRADKQDLDKATIYYL